LRSGRASSGRGGSSLGRAVIETRSIDQIVGQVPRGGALSALVNCLGRLA
jgi:hypothetical protein